MHVPVSDYPFPHLSEAELAKRMEKLRGPRDVGEYLIRRLGPHLPDLWPGGVPEGLPLLPDSAGDSLFPAEDETDRREQSNSELSEDADVRPDSETES